MGVLSKVFTFHSCELARELRIMSESSFQVPKQADLERELFFVKKKWYNIGLQLGVSDDKLDEIDIECGGNFEKGLRRMLREWRKQLEPNPSWAGLVKALRVCTIDEQDLAANLESRFVQVESTDHQALTSSVPRPSPPSLLDGAVVMRPDEVPDPVVQRELSHLYNLFEDLMMKVYTYLSEKKLDLKDFAVLVSSQPPSWKIKRPRLIPDVDFQRIIDTNTEFYQMFSIIRRYVSWHNYELLEKIVKRYGDADLKQQMQEYRRELADFERHTSAEVLKNIQFATAQSDSVAILAILHQHNCNQFTGADISRLKHKIAKKADLEEAAVRTYMIMESSVKIIFLVPSVLAPYVMVSSLAISPLLTSHSPLPVDICDRAVYTIHTEEVFHLMGRTVSPPAQQKSRSTSRIHPSGTPMSSSASALESSRLTEDSPPVLDPNHIHVHHHKVIMNGDNAVICKAQFLNLPCVAKYIHPKLSTSSTWQVDSFQNGCRLLQSLRHPNIVTYLGTYHDSGVVGPILLMEQMDLNLKDFLEKSNLSLLLLHTQLDICRDVAQGLEYLHAKDIIHGNLTATNVLVKGGRAKICGVTSLQLHTPDGEPSIGPGAAVCLPRRSFSSAIYDKAIDCFSFGVLALHVITREMPQPLTKILEPEDATISELMRYKKSLDKVDRSHPMHQLVIDCLEDVPFQRPTAQKLCKQVLEKRKLAAYQSSQRADLELVNLQIQFTQNAVQKKTEECRALQEELHQRLKELQLKDEELREVQSKAQVDQERMQTTITMLTAQNGDSEKRFSEASKELNDTKNESKEKTATMLAKIEELEKEKVHYKNKSIESDRGFARLLSKQDD